MIMKKYLFCIAIFLLTSVCGLAQSKSLYILHTNDAHSCIYPLSPAIQNKVFAGNGGFIRRVELIKRKRLSHPDLLLFDSGDFSQGSPYYTMFKGDVEIGLMNIMHYDAVTIGNHEFDFGLDNMVRLFKKANFPFVCSNYDFTGTPLENIVKSYIIIKRNGLKIGVFGLSPKLDGLVFTANYGKIKYLDPAEVTDRISKYLKLQAKCDVVICLSHLGWHVGGEDDQYTFSKSSYVDLVLGGHSHTYLKNLGYIRNSDNKLIPVDQNGKNAVFVGELQLDFSKRK